MFAERADEIFRKLITFVNISAHLAYEAFLAFRCRLRFYIVLIVVVGHGLDFGDHAGLGNAADEHSVGVHVNVLLYFQRHEGVNVFWQESKSVVRVQRLDASTCKLINGSSTLESKGLEDVKWCFRGQAVQVHDTGLLDYMVGVVCLLDGHCDPVRSVGYLRYGVYDQSVVTASIVRGYHIESVTNVEQSA